MAMVVHDHFPLVSNVTILGTDLSRDVLERARSGRYPQLEVNRGLPARLLVKHFTRHGAAWQLSDSIRRMVTFRQLNLAQPFDGVPTMDVVFLRNVLIYFDHQTKLAVLGRIARVMRPGGYIFLGAAETTYGIDDSFERMEAGKTIFYRLTRRNGVR